MSKLTEYPAVARFDANDILIKDGTNGTKKMTAANAAIEFAGLVSAKNHRNTWRGKSLGATVTAEQKAAIKNGSFDDLFIGDYWTINGTNWRIADMDYFINCGDEKFTSHHLVIVPDSALLGGDDANMNDSNTTEGGYANSKMRETSMATVIAKVKEAFSDMVLTHRDYFTNAVENGHPSAGAWFDSTVDLMNEVMVYGCSIFTPSNNGQVVPALYTTGNSQLSMFRLNPSSPSRRPARIYYWLILGALCPLF